MSYQVLARKWRPRTFQQMVGQEHVIRMLTNALDNQRLHHAYLFTGTRGVGKTTLSRLLAKCLNCETGITSSPCGTCSICLSIDAGRFLDLLEIDAASRTKVEDTRELLDNVQYAPSQGRFKIYLIDEVHMLSGHSFNALLKTLEEPPAHVKFLLATTDPKRLPVTILSRCLQFNLKNVPVEQISTQLQHICTEEKIPFEIPALEQIAQAADGSLRDSLSLLDQAIAFCPDGINSGDTLRMLGNVEQDYIFRLLRALAAQDGKTLLAEISRLAEQAPDFNRVLESMLSALHRIACVQIIKDTTAHPANITDLATLMPLEDVQLFYQIALLGRRDLPLAAHPVQGFEMILLRMLAFKPAPPGMQISQPASSAKVQAAAPANTARPVATETKTVTATATRTVTAPAPKAETPALSSDDQWSRMIPVLGLSGLAQVLATHCVLVKMENDGIELALSRKHETLLNKKLSERLETALSDHLQKKIRLTITITTAELNTSAKQTEETKKVRHASAIDAIKTDNQVQKIMDVFGATLDLNSVKALDTE
jgi:DNA polymerase-3 subunit gamma/tau